MTRMRMLAIAVVLLTACGTGAPPRGLAQSPPSAPGASGQVTDFGIVAYQGEDVLGGKQSTFLKVFKQGKPVVLNFWAGLCPPCRAEMPGFQRTAAAFQGQVIFVGLDVGTFVGLGTHDDAIKLYTALGIRYPLAYAVDASPLETFHVQGMPTTVFLDAKGNIVETVTGIVTEDQLRRTIQQKLLPP